MAVLMIFVFLLTTLLSACGKSAESQQGNPASDKEAPKSVASPDKKDPVTINFWMGSEGKIVDEYFANAIKKFEEQNPHIKVELTLLPSFASNVELKLNSAKLSGTLPDVFSAYLVFMGTWGARGEFESLNDYMSNWDGKDNIYESILKMGQYKGEQYGLAFFPQPYMLVYRKDFFQEAGLDPESPPKNWQELASYAEQLTQRDAGGNVTRAGLDIPYTNASVFLEPFMWQNGANLVDLDNDVPLFTDSKAVETLSFLVDTANKKVNIPYNYEKKEEIPFVKDRAAMSILSNSTILNLLATKPELKDKLGYAPVLQQEQKAAFSSNRVLTIFKTSKHKEEAWEFIKFMMSDEQAWERYKVANIPVVNKSLESRYVMNRSEEAHV